MNMNKTQEPRPVVVITGVSTGIGFAIAEDLMQRGYLVCGAVRRLADADGLVTRWGQAFVPLVFDVTDRAALNQAVTQVDAVLGGRYLAALINNAGIGPSGPLLMQPEEEIRKVFDVNVFGLLAVTRAFLPALGGRRGGTGPKGRVINMGSVSGVMTLPFMGAYSSSKHAVEAVGQALRRELKFMGIDVTTIEPGFIRTAMFEKTRAELKDDRYANSDYGPMWQRFTAMLMQQEEKAAPMSVVLEAVRHALESTRPRIRYPLDKAWHIGRWMPDRAFDKALFKMLGVSVK
jgi:NAD(P)-dependent dehydrogenase (short-subunit alcohol dehydrogenase family)